MAASFLLTMDELVRWGRRQERDWARGDLAAPVRKCGSIALKSIHEGFATSRAPDGTPWRPLARPRPGGGSKPLLATGALRDSIQIVFTPKGFTARTNRVRAAVHQYGATIRPKRAKMLAIPLTAEAAAVSSPRKFGKPLFAVGRGGTALLVERGRGKARGKAQYVLLRQVTIPARPFLGFSAQAVDEMTTVMADHMAKKLMV